MTNRWRYRAAGAVLLALVAILEAGCWGRSFFRAPTETLATSSKVDSLLRENALLRERIAAIELALRRNEELSRGANAQLKIDLEELKDQLGAIQEMLRESQESTPFKPSGRREPVRSDTSQVRQLLPSGAGTRASLPRAADADTAAGGAIDTTALAQRAAGGQSDSAGAAAAPAPPPEELFRQIYLYYSKREYQLAVDEAAGFLAEYPDDPLCQEVYFLRGESLAALGNHLEALKDYSTLLQRYPGGKRAPGALLRMAISYETMGQTELAAGVARRLIAEHPQSSEARTAEERFRAILQE